MATGTFKRADEMKIKGGTNENGKLRTASRAQAPRSERGRRLLSMQQNPEQLMGDLVDFLIEGRGLVAFAREHDIRYASLWQWVNEDSERRQAYEDAITEAAHAMFCRALEILEEPPKADENGRIDSAWVSLQKAKSDCLRWQASRLNTRFAERQQVDATSTLSISVALAEARLRVIYPSVIDGGTPLNRLAENISPFD